MDTPKDLLTAADVDQGYHDEPVLRLDGSPATIRIHLPTWRVRQKLGERIALDGGFEFLLVHCLIPPDSRSGGGPGRAADGGSSPAGPFESELMLDKLAPESLNRCFALAMAAVIGNDLAKKVVAASREKVALGLAAALSATGSASSAAASPPDGPQTPLPDGTGAGSSSSPASAKSNPSSET